MTPIETLCVIDDDKIYHYTVEKTARKCAFAQKILPFYNGATALAYFENELLKTENPSWPDVVLLDLNMPVMDGWTFLDQYVALRPRIGKKIWMYIVSSSVRPADLERAKAISEVSDYLIKPITTLHFNTLLEHIFNT